MENWQVKLSSLENTHQWDAAIELMIQVVNDYPDNVDAHLNMLYLLMNVRVEQPHDKTKNPYYEQLILSYFNDSYKKFHENSEYLFYAGTIAFMSEWFFGIESEYAEKMIAKGKKLDPNNIVYKWDDIYDNKNFLDPDVQAYAHLIFQKKSPIREILEQKGSFGKYFLGLMEHWATRILTQKTVS